MQIHNTKKYELLAKTGLNTNVTIGDSPRPVTSSMVEKRPKAIVKRIVSKGCSGCSRRNRKNAKRN